jgi:hypothetical protein
MATEKQIQANRLNAQSSTGPRSAGGKAASSQNALKSGAPSGPDSQSPIIHGEDPAGLDALAAQYLLDHQPQSAAGVPSGPALVELLIDSEWTLRRLRQTEARIWEYDLADISRQNQTFCRDNTTPDDQLLGSAFSRSQRTFARLERRRESLQRVYHPTLHDLRQFQASRPQALQPDIPAAPPPPEAPKPSAPPAEPPATSSSQKPNPEIGSVPEYPRVFDPANPVPPTTPSRAKC